MAVELIHVLLVIVVIAFTVIILNHYLKQEPLFVDHSILRYIILIGYVVTSYIILILLLMVVFGFLEPTDCNNC